MNLLLSGQLLEELHKTYRYLRVVPDEQDGRPILQASKGLNGITSNQIAQYKALSRASGWNWDIIPIIEPPPNTRTVVQIYPNRIWDIEELL